MNSPTNPNPLTPPPVGPTITPGGPTVTPAAATCPNAGVSYPDNPFSGWPQSRSWGDVNYFYCDPYYLQVFGTTHWGIDIEAYRGEPIYATADAVVVRASNDTRWGMGKNIKLCTPSGWCAVYMHLTDWAVSQGDSVSKGQVIGYANNTGNSTGITRFFLEESMWDVIINVIFDQLKSTLPQILKDVIAPSGTGPGAGLLYLALFLAGLLMIIPAIDHKRLVDPSRVLLWAFVIGLLFISNTTGYDIIGAIEKLRGDSANIIIGTNNRNLDDLVSDPMMANAGDLQNYSFVLSDQFEDQYFPEPTNFNNREAEIIDSVLLYWKMDIKVETEASQQDRREKGQTGLAVAGLTIIGAIVLIMIAFILATLTASALILIMFFLISLPIGFFEFGGAILNGIARQYTYIWAITLLSAILPRILIAANSLAYQSGTANLTQIMSTVPILIIVAIATSYISAMAGKAMLDTGMPARLTL